MATAIAAAGGACGDEGQPGDAGPADGGDGGLGPSPPTRAGVWLGRTSQQLSVSFLLTDRNEISDFMLRVRVELGGGAVCDTLYRSRKPSTVSGRVHTLEVETNAFNETTLPTVEVRFESDGTATGRIPQPPGGHRGYCSSGEFAEGLPGVSFSLSAQGDLQPDPADQRMATTAATPLGCSHQAGSSQQYCAFSSTNSGTTELWVVNMKQPVVAGCGTTSEPATGCQRLADKLSTLPLLSGAATVNRFVGDTLLFVTEAEAGRSDFRGPMFAWRPGWAAPRKLVDRVFRCQANPRSDAVACIGNSVYAAASPAAPTEGELFAGYLGDGSSPLQSVAKLAPSTFAVTDAHVLWEGIPDQLGQSRPLMASPLASPSMSRPLTSDHLDWREAPDGQTVFWLRKPQPGGSPPMPDARMGTLERISLSGDGMPVVLSPANVQRFLPMGRAGAAELPIVVLRDGRDLTYSPDVSAATPSWRTLDQGVGELTGVPAGGKRILYRKFGTKALWSLVDPAGGSAPCHLEGAPPMGGGASYVMLTVSATGAHALIEQPSTDPLADGGDLRLFDTTTCQLLHTHVGAGRGRGLPDGRFIVSVARPSSSRFHSLGTLDPVRPTEITPLVRWIGSGWTLVQPPDRLDQVDLWMSVGLRSAADGLYRRPIALQPR